MDKPDIPDFFINPNKQYSFDPDDFLSKYKWTLIGLVLAFLVVPNFLILVGAGQKAVIFNRITGMETRVLDEGVQFVIPFVNQTTIYNVREISYIFSDKSERSAPGARVMGGSINTLTSDGQNISVEVTVRARPDFINLWWVHQNLGNDGNSSYVNKIITPIVRSVVREVISGSTVTAIYSEDRRVIADSIAELLAKKLAKYNIYLSEFLLEEVTFSEAFQKAIEEKQKARIDLDTKDNIIIEEENKRDAIVTRAQGEAEAIRLKVDSLSRNPEYLRFRKAQVYGTRTKLLIDDKI
jgi:prohibitin 2